MQRYGDDEATEGKCTRIRKRSKVRYDDEKAMKGKGIMIRKRSKANAWR
jgi:hypothetical protein